MAWRQTHHSFFHGLKLELFYDFVRSCHSKGVARLLPSPPYQRGLMLFDNKNTWCFYNDLVYLSNVTIIVFNVTLLK